MKDTIEGTKTSLRDEIVSWQGHWSRNAAGSGWRSAGFSIEAPLTAQIESAERLGLRFDPASMAEDLPYLQASADSIAAVLDGTERTSWVEATADIGSATPAELMSAALGARGAHDSTHLSRFLAVITRDIDLNSNPPRR